MNQHYPFALPVGTEISGYEIVRVLGAGGFGITYEGFNPVTRRRAAIKEFFPRGIASRENATQVVFSREDTDVVSWALERFRRSTTELCAFSHPNIVNVLNYVPANETGYMFMEQVEGETLEQWLRAKGAAVTFDDLRGLLDPVCEALEYVHARKFIHRDIAPDNIMIRADGRPTLIDFGAIKIIAQQAQTRTASGRSYGVAKQHYSPPEQFEDDAELDPRADVYALGAVLYRAVSGNPPIDADKRKNDVVLKGADSYVSVAQNARMPLPQAVIDVIDRSLSLKPGERPSSVAEFRAALKANDSATATITPETKPVKVQPMPTPGFSGPGVKAPPAEPEAATSPSASDDRVSAQPVGIADVAQPVRRSRPWIGIAAVAAVVLIIAVVLMGSLTTHQQTTTNANNTTQQKQPPAGNARDALARADQLASQSRTQDAITAYGEALKLAGSEATLRISVFRGRAKQYGILSRYKEQIADLTELVNLEPKAENYSARGMAYWFASQYENAIADHNSAMKLDPKNASYVFERGRTNLWRNDFISAVADFSDAIRLNPNSSYYYTQRGTAHARRNDFTRALADYAEAIRMSPSSIDYYRERAAIYVSRADVTPASRTSDLNAAVADLDRVIAANVAVTRSADFEARGLAYEKLGNRTKAIEDLRESVRLDGNRSTSQQALRRLGG